MSQAVLLEKNYEPAAVEKAVYQRWLRSGAFDATPDARPPERRYVIMMPLPNVTGALHMGHAMDNVMQDLLIRWHRMQGDNTLWMPGTDHAGIATQAVVEKRLKELEGKTRHDLGREALVQRIWQWKGQYQARIIEQQQRMGCSCDWRRQRFTMDDVCARAVRHAFFKMFADGLIFRGKRLVNWDVFLQTSVSDDEVYHDTVQGHFWHLRYPVIAPKRGEPDHVVVATTRPETMLGDTAVAVHPDPAAALAATIDRLQAQLASASTKDKASLAAELEAVLQRRKDALPRLELLAAMARDGRQVQLPLLDRPVPLIVDAWAKPELGSGCVKITPAHDPNDYDVWQRHRDKIGCINLLNPDGTLNEAAGPYRGMERLAARDQVVADLDALGLLERVEDRQVEIGHSDRSKTPIEPYLSDQWFVRMGDVGGHGIVMGRATAKEHRAAGLVQAALDAVTSGRVRVHPERYTKTYLDWLAEKRDWPISRQLWWGHRIPVWSRRVAPGELRRDAERLGQWLAATDDAVSARLHRADDTSSIVVTARAALAADLPDACSGGCVLDVCLLADDEPQIAWLEDNGYRRDPDVLDTWFSSALWPASTLGWPQPATAAVGDGQAPLAAGGPNGAPDALSYYYPGSCLVTGRDIITLWVARMVIMGLYNLGDVPFADVFIHANILDGKGERMSKSKGNGIDPVDIIDQYGTDAMRYVLCDMQTGSQDIRLPVTAICPHCAHGNDLATTGHGASIFTYLCQGCRREFDVLGTVAGVPVSKLTSERFDVGRGFCTKLWNSARFVLMNLGDDFLKFEPAARFSRAALLLEDRWILDQLNQTVAAVHAGLADYNPSAALNAARDFFWSSMCDWYLELVKPRLSGDDAASGASAVTARQVLAYCLDQVLRLLHPFVPFITEELWQNMAGVLPRRGLGELAPLAVEPALVTAAWPQPLPSLEDAEVRCLFDDLQGVTRAIREVRSSAGLSPKQSVVVTIRATPQRETMLRAHGHVVAHLARVERMEFDAKARRRAGQAAKVVGDLELYVHDVIDDAAERQRLQTQLKKIEKDLASCAGRLNNPQFRERAPAEVIAELEERRTTLAASQASLGESLRQLD